MSDSLKYQEFPNSPFFSVLMPVRNEEKHLDEALESLQKSSFGNWELILVNDGSTDRSRDIVLARQRKDRRIRLVDSRPEGLVAALQKGLALCRAPWVARFDGDDLMAEHRLRWQKEMILENPALKALGGGVELFPQSDIRGGLQRYVEWLNEIKSNEDFRRDIYVEAPICHGTLCFHRESILELGGYRQGPWPEDYDLYLRIYEKGLPVACLKKTLLYWRHRAGRSSFQDTRYRLEAFRFLKIESLLKTRLKNLSQVSLIGAGKEGKIWAKALKAKGLDIAFFVEVHPGKIGQNIHGAPVIPYEELLPRRRELSHLLVTVGIKGAREQIREELLSRGFVEEKDFSCVA
jgi:glycosyltransferase involved in cell wall biosynthesis